MHPGPGAPYRQGMFEHSHAIATLIVNPATDVGLVALANRLVTSGIGTADALQRELRRFYPVLVVRRRELAGERFETWYVYREGHWIPTASTDSAGAAETTQPEPEASGDRLD